MTRRALITKAEILRRVAALQAAGLGIAEIKPDGTIVIGTAAAGGLSDPLQGRDPETVFQERLAQRSWARSR
jgi:hypothetical protein